MEIRTYVPRVSCIFDCKVLYLDNFHKKKFHNKMHSAQTTFSNCKSIPLVGIRTHNARVNYILRYCHLHFHTNSFQAKIHNTQAILSNDDPIMLMGIRTHDAISHSDTLPLQYKYS